MKSAWLGAAAAFCLVTPEAARAQPLPQASVALVDARLIARTCTACVAANQQLQAQGQQLEQRMRQLGVARTQPDQPTALEAEAQAIQTAIDALAPEQPIDPALQARFQNHQVQVQNAQREIAARNAQIERNRQFAADQIDQRLIPIVRQITRERGANIAVDVGSTLAFAPALDITTAVLAALNSQLQSVSVEAPPPQAPAEPQGPQGR